MDCSLVVVYNLFLEKNSLSGGHIVDPTTYKQAHSLTMSQYERMDHPLTAKMTLYLREFIPHLVVVFNRGPLIRLAIIKYQLGCMLFDQFLVHDLDRVHLLTGQEETVLHHGAVQELLGGDLGHVALLSREETDDRLEDRGSGKDEPKGAHSPADNGAYCRFE